MGLCKQVIYETHVGKAFQAGAVCHRAMTLTLQSTAVYQQKPQNKQHMMTLDPQKAPRLPDTTRCDDIHVTAGGLLCRMRAQVQAGIIVPLSHLVM